jgi:hypothetical protein
VPKGAKIGQKASLTLGIPRLTAFTDPLHDVKGVIGEYLRSLCGETARAALPVLCARKAHFGRKAASYSAH